ncbi:hypothetical protein KUL42_41540 [Alteromonas sp. KUL42]|nr:hypothetical protein KUL42_41540 [Alteromonas sp. KUL42]
MGATVGTVAVFSLLVLKQHEEDGEIVRGFSNSERWNFLSINLSTLIFNWGGVLIVGIFLGSEEVYQIGVAQRVGAVIAFSLFLSNSILAPRVSKLFCKGKILDLMNLTKSVNRVLIFIGVVTLIVIFYDKRFLSFFFDEQVFIYIDVIKVVCGAHFINVIFGNCTTLLSMTGGEKKLNLAMMSAAVSNVLFTIPLTYFYGVIGTGIAFLVSMALMNVLCLFFVKEHLGFWLLGGIAFKCKVHDD